MDIVLSHVKKSYPGTPVFEDLSLTFAGGGIHCVLGESGSGKTTLLHLIGGITPCDGGTVEGAERVSCLFQEERLLPNLTVLGNVEYVLSRFPKAERRAMAERALGLAHIAGAKNRYPGELSGGMAQRVSMARAFAYPSDVLLMDEPFHALDLGLKLRLMRTLKESLRETGRTAVFVTHDLDEALLLADEIFVFGKKPSGVTFHSVLESCEGLRDLSDPVMVDCKKRLTRCMLDRGDGAEPFSSFPLD